MSDAPITPAEELTALRHQLEALTQHLARLEQRLADGSAAPAPADDIPWVVIMAAVAAVVREPFRIVSLQMPGLPPLNLWSIEGRRTVFHSHRLR